MKAVLRYACLASTWVLVFASSGHSSACDLEQARFASGTISLTFGGEFGNDFELVMPKAKFKGYLEAISGYGYTAYSLFEVGGSPNEEPIGGTVYGLKTKGKVVADDGVWGGTKAPQAILMTDVGRNVFYYLRDKKREKDFTRFDDVFNFVACE